MQQLWSQARRELSKGWVKNFAPISPSDMEMTQRPVDFWAQTLVPTLLKPLLNIAMDETSFGSPLTPQSKNKNKLKSDQPQRTTPQIYADMAHEIHQTLGVDMYPDQIKALSDGYVVGPIREITSMLIDNEAKKARGEPGRMPLIASVVDNINDRQMLNSIYYRVYGNMDDAHRTFSSMMADPHQRGEITPEMRSAERAYQAFAANEKVIGVQRAALRRMTNLDEDAHDERQQAIESRADANRRRILVHYFNAQ